MLDNNSYALEDLVEVSLIEAAKPNSALPTPNSTRASQRDEVVTENKIVNKPKTRSDSVSNK